MNDPEKMSIASLILSIEEWSNTYQFSFQFWGIGLNNVFIYKHDVEIYSSGDHENINEALIDALKYIYRINDIRHE